METFHGKNVLITGGTSGLGLALARQLIELNAHVAVIARHRGNVARVTREHPGIIGLVGDISSKTSIHPLAGEVHARLGDVDYLFNVASELGPTPLRLLLDTECEDFELVLQTNLLGPFRLSKALLPAMMLKGEGVVVNISSDAAVSAYPHWGAYGVSKAALDHLSRIFDAELQARGVRFLAIDPGDMRTPLHFAAIADADPDTLRDPDESARLILTVLANRDYSVTRRSV
jgi:NAD(P)-dependent dehydrogenase (short-subunit alcohol dehydrogenase family)